MAVTTTLLAGRLVSATGKASDGMDGTPDIASHSYSSSPLEEAKRCSRIPRSVTSDSR